MSSPLWARNTATNDSPSINDPWPVSDIVYIAIVGTVMVAALLEWILWLLAFLYCLVKVFQKATGEGKWSIRFLVVINMVIFIALRCIFLPIMVVTLPLPSRIVREFPSEMVSILQWFAFWAFAGLLTIPWLFCVYQLVTHNIGRARRVKTVLDETTAPKVVIILPCYNETPEILLRTVDSIADCDYPTTCMHIFLSFDGDQEGELYLKTIEKLGVPLTLRTYPKSIDVTYRGCRVTVSRFTHGGKRSCQKKSFRLIDRVYAEYLRRHDDLFLLFIDSDCILDKNCVQNFMYEMELKPGSERNMLAMTGVITSTTEKNSLITVLQDMEYIHGQLFERSVESGCGAVTCLPGALTILRFSAFRRMAKYYFADKAEQCDDLFDYGKCHLGEDRWLTHLFMIGSKQRYQIQMNTGAFCKTEAVQTFKSLLKQRRRWFLGFITNEVCMLTDIRLWKRYPLLLIIRLAQNTIRTTALLFFIMVISIISTSQKIANLPVGFIAVSLGLNWALMLYFGAKLGRYKIMLYPLMFIVNPFFNWLYMVYGIFTAGQRTWGGPRADAGKADVHTTPSEAVARAEKAGDELNVVPETFKPALEATVHKIPRGVPLMPAHRMEGRFAPAEALPGGWYQQQNDSGVLQGLDRRDPEKHGRRDSTDSAWSSSSSVFSVHTPRRVESIFSPEDARTYLDQQIGQQATPGTYYGITVYQADPAGPAAASRPSLSRRSSASSVSLHYGFQNLATVPPPLQQPVPLVPRARSLSPPKQPYTTQSSKATKSPLARKSFTRLASPPVEEDTPPPIPPLSARPTPQEIRERAHSQPPSQPRTTIQDIGADGIATPSAAEVISLERQSAAAARASRSRSNSRSRPSSRASFGSFMSVLEAATGSRRNSEDGEGRGRRRERRRLSKNPPVSLGNAGTGRRGKSQ